MVICKESSKPSKLSTKLSTIWQINDYLSKKIDNRLIVDIIDTRGHPGYYCSQFTKLACFSFFTARSWEATVSLPVWTPFHSTTHFLGTGNMEVRLGFTRGPTYLLSVSSRRQASCCHVHLHELHLHRLPSWRVPWELFHQKPSTWTQLSQTFSCSLIWKAEYQNNRLVKFQHDTGTNITTS